MLYPALLTPPADFIVSAPGSAYQWCDQVIALIFGTVSTRGPPEDGDAKRWAKKYISCIDRLNLRLFHAREDLQPVVMSSWG
jgi:hypothetical protein